MSIDCVGDEGKMKEGARLMAAYVCFWPCPKVNVSYVHIWT